MAYRKRMRRTKRPRAKTAIGRYRTGKIKRIVNNLAERKFIDTFVTEQGQTWFATSRDWNRVDLFSLLIGLIQGTTQSTRIGRTINLVGLDICLCIRPGSTFIANFPLGVSGAFALVEDKQTNSSVTPFTNVFSGDACMGMRNQLYLQRYVVHDFQRVTLSPGFLTPMHLRFTKTWPKGKKITFISNAGTISDFNKSNFYIICSWANTFPANTAVTIGGQYQVKFCDE